MKRRIVLTIFRKELVETLRDKRTLVAMLGIPLLLYPTMTIISSQVAMSEIGKVREKASRVAIVSDADGPLWEWVAQIPKIQVVYSASPHDDLVKGDLEAVIVPQGSILDSVQNGCTADLTIECDRTDVDSVQAFRRLKDGLDEQRDALLGERLEAAGLDREWATPIKIEEKNIATAKRIAGFVGGAIVPFFLILMIAMGALYPAIDLTAGEKERGTFETLLSTPTSKVEIVAGKFLTVLSIALIVALLNVASMSLSGLVVLWQIMASAPPEGNEVLRFVNELGMGDMALIAGTLVLLLIPLTFFLCAAMMTVAVLARDFKDGQNFVTPFFIAIALPMGFAMVPSAELTPATMFVPIANIVLLFRDMLMGRGSIEAVFGVFLSTAIYAVMALVVAVWIFQREEVILAEDKGVPLTLRRAAFVPRAAPPAGFALFLFALAMLLTFYIGASAQAWDIILGLLVTEWVVLLLPVLFLLWFIRVDLRSALSLHRPRPGALAGAILIVAGLAPWLIQFVTWQNRILPMPEDMAEEFQKLFDFQHATGGFPLLFFAIAISPAICEEVLFRGAILSGLRTKLNPAATVVVVGVLFGLMHVSIYRIFITGLLGMAITYVAIRSGSIFPGMLMHFLVNGTAILLENEKLPGPVLRFLGKIDLGNANGLPWSYLIAGTAIFAVGVTLIERSHRWAASRTTG